MRDELFDHLKHKLAETEVPDPDTGWQRMRALLDSTASPRPAILLRRWYVAAACLILAGGAWALIHEVHVSRERAPLAVTGQTRVGSLPAGQAGTTANGATTNGTTANGTDQTGTASSGEAPSGAAQPNAAQSAAAQQGPAQTGPAQTAAAQTTTAQRDIPRQGNTQTNDVQARITHLRVPGRSGNDEATEALAAAGQSGGFPVSQGTTGNHADNHGNHTDNHGSDATAGLTGVATGAMPDLTTPFREKPLAMSVRSLSSTASPAGPIRPGHHSRWGLDVGLGANFPGSMRTVTVNNQSKWEPGLYPVLMTRYRLTSRLSIKAGVAGPSPVSYSKTLSQNSLRVSDSSVQAMAAAPVSTSSTKIGRLLYLDIPVSVEWAVVPRLNVEAGVQYSRLLTEQDDTQTTTLTPTTNFALYYPATASTHDQQPQVRCSDIRYLVGANYTWHRFSASVQYQRGLQHSANQVDDQGNSIVNHTSVAKMQIMYTLR